MNSTSALSYKLDKKRSPIKTIFFLLILIVVISAIIFFVYYIVQSFKPNSSPTSQSPNLITESKTSNDYVYRHGYGDSLQNTQR